MNFQDLENVRESYAKTNRKLIAPIAIGIALLMVIALVAAFGNFLLVLLLFLIIVIDVYYLFKVISERNKIAKVYESLYKSYFVEQSIKKIFTEVDYHHEAGITAEELKAIGTIRMGDTYSSNDLFTAKYQNVPIKQADVSILQSHEDSDGNTYYTTVFEGKWMIYEFPKKFTFRLQVIQNGFKSAMIFSENKALGRKAKKITTESPTFNDMFTVYAEDDFEAYYLLDPSFIDHLEQISNQQQGKIMLFFDDSKLHIAIHNEKDAFEPPSPRKQINETAELAKINQEIKTITDFVDFLNLDRKLFKNN